MGIVAVLETPEHIATYAVHPAHLEYVTCYFSSVVEVVVLTLYCVGFTKCARSFVMIPWLMTLSSRLYLGQDICLLQDEIQCFYRLIGMSLSSVITNLICTFQTLTSVFCNCLGLANAWMLIKIKHITPYQSSPLRKTCQMRPAGFPIRNTFMSRQLIPEKQ